MELIIRSTLYACCFSTKKSVCLLFSLLHLRYWLTTAEFKNVIVLLNLLSHLLQINFILSIEWWTFTLLFCIINQHRSLKFDRKEKYHDCILSFILFFLWGKSIVSVMISQKSWNLQYSRFRKNMPERERTRAWRHADQRILGFPV